MGRSEKLTFDDELKKAKELKKKLEEVREGILQDLFTELNELGFDIEMHLRLRGDYWDEDRIKISKIIKA